MTTGTPRRPPTWRQMQADTAPWAERLQFKFFREAPAWLKLQTAGNLTRWAISMAQAEVRRQLADKILGPELAARMYRPIATVDEAGNDGTGA